MFLDVLFYKTPLVAASGLHLGTCRKLFSLKRQSYVFDKVLDTTLQAFKSNFETVTLKHFIKLYNIISPPHIPLSVKL